MIGHDRPILCPVDYSSQSRRALQWAAAIARRRGGALVVLSVVEPLLAQAAGIQRGVERSQTEELSALREFVDSAVPSRDAASNVVTEVAVGKPADVILETSRRLDSALIVMGTHGRGGLQKLVLGSTTEQVLSRTERPVLAVPPTHAIEPHDVRLNRILVATDFHTSAMTATHWAADLASELDVPLTLAHVVEPVTMPPRWQVLAADFESDRVTSSQRRLATLSAHLRVPHNDWVVSVGQPADTIAELSGERRADLIVMGLAVPEYDELRKPGSTAYRVLRRGDVPVVVVPEIPRAHLVSGERAAATR